MFGSYGPFLAIFLKFFFAEIWNKIGKICQKNPGWMSYAYPCLLEGNDKLDQYNCIQCRIDETYKRC